VAFLRERKSSDEQELSTLERNIADLDRRSVESEGLGDSLQVTLTTLYDALERCVHDDLPFRLEEREPRLSELKNDLSRPDNSPAEKIRRLLQVYQIEAAYGATADVMEQPVTLGADTFPARVLRVGRLALFWRTKDGRRVGRYDRSARSWVELGSMYRKSIGQAFDMVERRRPIEAISLPVGRIDP
jgi:hypothetical protein